LPFFSKDLELAGSTFEFLGHFSVAEGFGFDFGGCVFIAILLSIYLMHAGNHKAGHFFGTANASLQRRGRLLWQFLSQRTTSRNVQRRETYTFCVESRPASRLIRRPAKSSPCRPVARRGMHHLRIVGAADKGENAVMAYATGG
jgi:hypothetical protein